jgi:hypothetical protein
MDHSIFGGKMLWGGGEEGCKCEDGSEEPGAEYETCSTSRSVAPTLLDFVPVAAEAAACLRRPCLQPCQLRPTKYMPADRPPDNATLEARQPMAGIGLILKNDKCGFTFVACVVPGSSADRCGVQHGDCLVEVCEMRDRPLCPCARGFVLVSLPSARAAVGAHLSLSSATGLVSNM